MLLPSRELCTSKKPSVSVRAIILGLSLRRIYAPMRGRPVSCSVTFARNAVCASIGIEPTISKMSVSILRIGRVQKYVIE